MNVMLKLFTLPTVAAALLLATSTNPLAQATPAPSIGIVDIQKVMRESMASLSIRPTVDRMRKEFQKQVSSQEQRLRRSEQELSRQRAILAPETFAQKRRKFSAQAREAQVSVQRRRSTLERAFNNTKNEILKNLIVVAQQVATEKNLNFMIEKRFVLISATSLDVTDEIMKRLNERLPKVEIDLSLVGKGDAKGKK
ncbi:MAG: hypothetical protein CFH41_00479 [Alphaproteobacteria bacterium MarineAlpha11_Bin1]|nr:MAG: hypothetical protein CFH41_00479 [Alphaproteobacteria bacterium MarineAlpha11_Bin1]|tara:strand:- start:2407 stop:2997 length:591 start_codon:yes stop_codon:yes gene_type:complete